jgi:chaperonin GroES
MAQGTDKSLANLIVVGDRVLIKPKKASNKSKGGLLLPPGYTEKEEIQTGFIVKCGPGFPIPQAGDDSSEPWKKEEELIKYIPLQVREGDLAIFLQRGAMEIVYNDTKYYLVSQSSILLVERDSELFE